MFQEFPKWKYHATKKAVIVPDAEAEKALGEGWHDHPSLAKAPPSPEKPPPAEKTAGERDMEELAAMQQPIVRKRIEP